MSSLLLYREALPKFVWLVLPLLALSNIFDLSFDSDPTSGPFWHFGVSLLLESIAGAVALVALLRVKFPAAQVSLSVRSLARFLFASIYVGIAATLAAILLILPAFWVLSATFLTPVFVLAGQQGPIDAITSSAAQTKGHLVKILPLLLAFFSVAILVGFGASYLPQPLLFLVSLALSVAGLYYYALIVVAYANLHPNPPLNTDAPPIGGAPVS